MRVDNLVLESGKFKKISSELDSGDVADIVFVFGDTDVFKLESTYNLLKEIYPNSHIVGTSSSGNILGKEVSNHSIVASAVKFEKSKVEVASIIYKKEDDLEKLSFELVDKLNSEGLKHIFVLSDGLNVNGSELVRGINKAAKNIEVTGGMAGDGGRFQETYVISNDIAKQNQITIIGFYGDDLVISSGCFGGWSEFGAQRVITKSIGNVVYEIDNEPALDLYKKYLGDYAADLPNSGLRFPLSIRENSEDTEKIRTLLAIDEEAKSITFAGDVPQGYSAKLMKHNIDELIHGAGRAADEIIQANDKSALGLVVSCVGRKIVLGQLVDEELEEIGNILGDNVNLVGFYSYGEIAPFEVDKLKCELHNQTMTLTTIYEN